MVIAKLSFMPIGRVRRHRSWLSCPPRRRSVLYGDIVPDPYPPAAMVAQRRAAATRSGRGDVQPAFAATRLGSASNLQKIDLPPGAFQKHLLAKPSFV